jgi:hypothetical protein
VPAPDFLKRVKPEALPEPSPETAREACVEPERRQACHKNPGTESGIRFIEKTHVIGFTLSLLILRGI